MNTGPRENRAAQPIHHRPFSAGSSQVENGTIMFNHPHDDLVDLAALSQAEEW